MTEFHNGVVQLLWGKARIIPKTKIVAARVVQELGKLLHRFRFAMIKRFHVSRIALSDSNHRFFVVAYEEISSTHVFIIA